MTNTHVRGKRLELKDLGRKGFADFLETYDRKKSKLVKFNFKRLLMVLL